MGTPSRGAAGTSRPGVPGVARLAQALPGVLLQRRLAPVHADGGEDEQWWWDGWEESEGGRPEDGPFGLPDSEDECMDVDVEEGRLGRPAMRRADAYVA